MLLGQKDLLQAAWVNSAPHHAFGRSLKVGKEEIMGMLAAVEMWVKRDHEAEWKQWEAGWTTSRSRRPRSPASRREILQPEDLSNHAPRLRMNWDAAQLGITGNEVEELLLHGQPRIVVNGASGTRRDSRPSSLTIMPYMMMPGDDKIAAAAIRKLLAKPPQIAVPERGARRGRERGNGRGADLRLRIGKTSLDHRAARGHSSAARIAAISCPAT